MSDSDDTATPEASTPKSTEAPKPPVRIIGQYTKDLSFENFTNPGEIMASDARADMQAKVDVTATLLSNRQFEVALHLEAQAKAGDEKLYLIELVYAATVELGEVAEEHVEPLLFIEVPRFLFPFVRAIVANVTRDGGFPGLMGESIDFVEMFKRRMASRQQPQAEAAPQEPPA